MTTVTPRTTPSPYQPARAILAQSGTNPAVAHALTAVDGLDDAREAYTHLRAQVEAMSAPEGTAAVVAEVVATLTAGGTIPEDAEARYAQARHAHPAHLALVGELSAAVHAAEDTYLSLITHALPAMLDALSANLSALIEDGGPALAEVAAVPDADAAIRAGLADAWRDAQDVRTGYRQIRDAQRQLLRLTDDTTRDLLTTHWDAACIVGRPSGWEHWEDWTRYGGAVDRNRDVTPLDLPWTGPGALAWLAAHPEVAPGVPSLDTARRTAHAVEAARDETRRTSRGQLAPGFDAPVLTGNRLLSPR